MRISIDEWRTAPIRSFAQIAAILRDRGDTRLSEQVAQKTHRRAIRKLRLGLLAWEKELEQ